jgi:hypothetical protein
MTIKKADLNAYDNAFHYLVNELNFMKINETLSFGQTGLSPVFSVKRIGKGFEFSSKDAILVLEDAASVLQAAENELQTFYRVAASPMTRKLQKALRTRYGDPFYTWNNEG